MALDKAHKLNPTVNHHPQLLTSSLHNSSNNCTILPVTMAPPPNTPANKPSIVKALYRGLASPDPAQSEPPLHHTFQHELSTSLSSPSPDDISQKSAYLSELKHAVVSLQAEVNTYLTARMEEDSSRISAAARLGEKDERREEENYGEEVVDEDED